jgi:hypothetical protein
MQQIFLTHSYLFGSNQRRQQIQIPGSTLEATGATTLEIEKRISKGRRVIGMLNSCLVEQNYPSQNQKNLCTRL